MPPNTMNDAEIIAKAQAEFKRRQAALALQKAQEAEKLRLQDATAHDAAERDDGDLGRAAADVDHHVPRRRLDREPDPDRGRHRLRDHEDFLGPGA